MASPDQPLGLFLGALFLAMSPPAALGHQARALFVPPVLASMSGEGAGNGH